MSYVVHYTWQDFDSAIDFLVRRLPANTMREQGFHIYGEPRGGLPLAVALSHYLDLPIAHSIYGPGILWVDDIVDRGVTYKGRYNECAAAGIRFVGAVWVTKLGLPDVMACAVAADPEAWIVFPWENRERVEADRADFEKRRAG